MIGFAGLSHLGVVTSIATASKGYQVVAYDPDAEMTSNLSRGCLPVWEPQLSELLDANKHHIDFTSYPAELSRCELIFFSSDVQTDQENRSDLTGLQRQVEEVAALAAPGTILVILSQVPPGFTRQLADSLSHSPIGSDLNLFCQVETLVFGRAVERALHPERIIVGRSHSDVSLPTAYSGLLNSFGCPVLLMGYESVELAKASVNMFLASSVCVTNTLAELCEAIGADWSEIVPALQSDKRIGPHAYLSPGLGLSGGNLERDLVTISALASEFGTDAAVVDSWLANSSHRRDWVLKTLHDQVLTQCDDPAIAIWGLAYKPETASTKNSPSLALIEALRPFSVRAYDPQAVLEYATADGASNAVQEQSALEACRGADALAIMTPWREFSSVDLGQVRELMAGRIVVDPFRVLDGDKCSSLGFAHFKLGSSAPVRAPAV